jgi:hypothetical protein
MTSWPAPFKVNEIIFRIVAASSTVMMVLLMAVSFGFQI